MIGGIVIAAVFAGLQSSCQGTVNSNGQMLVAHPTGCAGWGLGAGAGVALLAVGALLMVGAVVRGSLRDRDLRRAASQDAGREEAEPPSLGAPPDMPVSEERPR